MVKSVINVAKAAALGAIMLQVARSSAELTELAIDKVKEKLNK